jgi:hypothetical protein
MRLRPSASAACLLTAGLLLAGCGSSSHAPAASTHGTAATHAKAAVKQPKTATSPKAAAGPVYRLPKRLTIPDPPPTGIATSAADLAVVKAWSTDLRQGDVTGAARYFADPSAFVNGVGSGGLLQAVEIRTLAESKQVNASLPCGATFVSADQRGRYVNVLFRLGSRKGPGSEACSGSARVNFVISRGKIVEWIRAPADPGDPGTGTGTGTVPTPSEPLSQVPMA